MKKNYQAPDINVLYVDVADILTTSGMGEQPDDVVGDEMN